LGLSVDLEPGIKEIHVDFAPMKRVIDNLLDNAAKYSLEHSTIALRVSRTTPHTLISVNDSGIGIPEADLPFVFEPFFRTDRSRARGTGGTGFGLCKRIVEAHGGAIEARSDGKNGATFSVSLPM
jgi:two-component system, OmpR family, sensor kinase